MPSWKELRESFNPRRKPRAQVGRGDGRPEGGILIASSMFNAKGETETVRGLLEKKGLIEKTRTIDGTTQFLISASMPLGAEVPTDYYDFPNYLDTYYYMPQVGTATDLKQSLIWQMGYTLEGSDADVKRVENYLKEIDADTTLRDDSFWALLFGNAYWRIVDGKPVALDPMRMGVKIDASGAITTYIYAPPRGQAQNIAPEEILHLKYNAKPWEPFGTSPFRKVYPTAKIIMDMESDLPTIVKRRSDPPIAVQIGEHSGANRVSDEDYTRLEAMLKQRKAGEDITHDGVFQFEEVYKSGGAGTHQTVEPLIDHFMMNLVAGLSVPEIALGQGGTTTMATAEYQERILDAEVRAYQRVLKRFHEKYIFPMAGVAPSSVKLNWNPTSPEDKAEVSKQLMDEIEHGVISPEYARQRLGYEDKAGEGAVMSINLKTFQAVNGEGPALPPETELEKKQKAYLDLMMDKIGEERKVDSKRKPPPPR